MSQTSEMFDQMAFRKYMHYQGRAYQNQAIELIAICRLFSQVAHQVFTQHAELTKCAAYIMVVRINIYLTIPEECLKYAIKHS